MFMELSPASGGLWIILAHQLFADTAVEWLTQLHALSDRDDTDPVKRSKTQTARYFFEMVLPEAKLYAAKVRVGKTPMTEVEVDLL